MDIIKSIEHEQLKNKIPDLKVGNTVRVHVRIKEGNKERIQVFEGIIIKKQGGGLNATFTVSPVLFLVLSIESIIFFCNLLWSLVISPNTFIFIFFMFFPREFQKYLRKSRGKL